MMERSELLVFLNSSTHSVKSSIDNSSSNSKTSVVSSSLPIDGSKNNHEDSVIRLKDFINGSDGEDGLFIEDNIYSGKHISFSSINSSIEGKTINDDLDTSNNNDLRNLLCVVLTKLDFLENR